MKILFGSAELSPYVRTGGLGDAVAGLATALASDHQVTVAVPGYAEIGAQGRKLPGKPWRRRRDAGEECTVGGTSEKGDPHHIAIG